MSKKPVDCYECGKDMYLARITETVDYEGLVSEPFESPLYRCDCGAEIVTGTQMQVMFDVVAALKARAAEAAEKSARVG